MCKFLLSIKAIVSLCVLINSLEVKTMQERNQAVLQIEVSDVNDDKPTIHHGYWPEMYGYILGVADNLSFNTSVFQVVVSL